MGSASAKWASQFVDQIFDLNEDAFNDKAMELFRFQYTHNKLYREYCQHLSCDIATVTDLKDIPFLPISLFKSHEIRSTIRTVETVFESSGTTGNRKSKHYVEDLSIYINSFIRGFQHFYGSIKDYHLLALLPSYLERKGSSLVYMVHELIQMSQSDHSNFYLHNVQELKVKLDELNRSKEKVLLIGVSFGLLDFVEKFQFTYNPNLIVMETGGMKGRRKELVRDELHEQLKKGFHAKSIHSEYGMTELLSQAYAKEKGLFQSPPWMKIMIRKQDDPFAYCNTSETGAINVIDLANLYSCPFIQTDDLGRLHPQGDFEVLGRFDQADVRGCNLMMV